MTELRRWLIFSGISGAVAASAASVYYCQQQRVQEDYEYCQRQIKNVPTSQREYALRLTVPLHGSADNCWELVQHYEKISQEGATDVGIR